LVRSQLLSFEEETVKKIVLALALCVATAAAANAQTAAKSQTPATGTKATPAAPSTHAAKAPAAKASTMKAEVVSTDATAKTITVKDAAGASTTLTATGGAVASLANVKAGDWVMVTKSDMNATRISKVKATGGKKAGKTAKSSTK
jgi:glucose/arabinose dehydrogenase